MPPECCSFDVNEFSMKKADVWSLGLTLYCMTFNKLPFSISGTELETMESICNFELSFPETREISEELKELLQMML
jgi:serine/threonine protein kinase